MIERPTKELYVADTFDMQNVVVKQYKEKRKLDAQKLEEQAQVDKMNALHKQQ